MGQSFTVSDGAAGQIVNAIDPAERSRSLRRLLSWRCFSTHRRTPGTCPGGERQRELRVPRGLRQLQPEEKRKPRTHVLKFDGLPAREQIVADVVRESGA